MSSPAARCLATFRGEIKPVPRLTKDESTMYTAIHTYLRKGMDSPLACAIWAMVARSMSQEVFCAFVQALNEVYRLPKRPKGWYSDVEWAMRAAYQDSGDPDAVILWGALMALGEDEVGSMLDAFKQDGWV